jgi:hypothetical protein
VSSGRATVDVVIVAYNSRDTLRGCVERLVGVPWVRTIVVDNASPDDSGAAVADLPVDVIRAPRNGGFAYGCNLGIATGDSPYVLLLNPDASISAESLDVLCEALQADPRLGGVGPRTVDDDGNLSFTQRRFPRLRSTYAQGLFLHRAAPLAEWSDDAIRDPRAYERPATPDWVSGCCVLLRRDAVEQVGGLDEGFFLFSEEIDLFRRLTSAGWHVGFDPRATARHTGDGSGSWYRTEGIRAYSRVRYARKHHGPIVATGEAVGLALGAVAHAAIWVGRPARACGHLQAARAALAAVRTVGATV